MDSLLIEQLTPNEDGTLSWVVFEHQFDTEADFIIDPENLDGEICKMGKLLLRYGDAHSLLEAQMERHKKEMEFVYATYYLEYRKNLLAEGERAPDAVIKSHVTINSNYQAVTGKYIESCRYYNKVDAWWRTLLKKSDLMQALTYRQNSEIKRGAY
jgi:hypothetical protein